MVLKFGGIEATKPPYAPNGHYGLILLICGVCLINVISINNIKEVY
jgi:hypothetical protein